MSLGRSGSRDATCTDYGLDDNGDSYHETICGAVNAGTVFAVAAGNSAAHAEGAVPAAYNDTVLAVSAVQQDEDAEGEVFAEFSNWGDGLFDWLDDQGPQSAPVALAAPGVDVLSTWNDGRLHVGSGTSMAAPHVAGGAVLLIAAHDVSGEQGRQAFLEVRAALMDGAESTDGWEDDSSFEDEADDLEQRQEGFLDLRFLE